MELKGKIALVLGAVKGIGNGIGLALAKEGAALILTRYDWEDSYEKMEMDFAKIGADHIIVASDLRNVKEAYKIHDIIKKRYGRLDILINNIERGGWPVVHGKYTPDQWDLEIETTLKAKRYMFDAVYPLLKKSDNAVVINVSSIAADVGRSGPAAAVFNDGYAAANKGISILTETWARIGAPNIRVNEIMLGIFKTRHAEETRGWREAISEEDKKALIDHILLGRTGNIEDVVNACLFIIKDAPYMTGAVLRLDGGYVIGGQKTPPIPKGIL
jgi:3-oxoacyl-[acyl-carrier protein] reductase